MCSFSFDYLFFEDVGKSLLKMCSYLCFVLFFLVSKAHPKYCCRQAWSVKDYQRAGLGYVGGKESGYPSLSLEQHLNELLRAVGFPDGSVGKESAYNVGYPGSIPGLGRSPGEGNGNPDFLPGEFHGQRSLEGYSPWGHRVIHNWATNIYTSQWESQRLFLYLQG